MRTKAILLIAIACSLIAIFPLAEKTGGACNAGVAIIALMIMLAVCALLTFAAEALEKRNKRFGLIPAVISIAIWIFIAVMNFPEAPLLAILFFIPFFLAQVYLLVRMIK